MDEGISYKKPGVGMAMVVAADAVAHVIAHLAAQGCESCPTGSIVKGARTVTFRGALRW
jgi:phosphoribosylaminoimidazole (AIR) synthetase